MYLIIKNKKKTLILCRIDIFKVCKVCFYRLKAEGDNFSRVGKGNLLWHISLLRSDKTWKWCLRIMSINPICVCYAIELIESGAIMDRIPWLKCYILKADVHA